MVTARVPDRQDSADWAHGAEAERDLAWVSVYRANVAASSATKPASPAQVRRRELALAASTVRSAEPSRYFFDLRS